MVEIIAVVVAIVSLVFSGVVLLRLFMVENRLHSINAIGAGNPTPALSQESSANPLSGLRIGLAISQDHSHPVFVDLLKEQLFKEDVTDISILTPGETRALQDSWKSRPNAPDIFIAGDVVCNGYAEVYYEAEFTCSTPEQAICTLIEKPPHGDRPSNLALELVTRLKAELQKVLERNERRSAIRELGS